MVSKVRNDVSCCGKDCQPVSGKMDFYKIDIDISKEIAEYIGIEIVPTFVVYRDGKSVDIQPEFFQKKLWKNESGKC